MIRLCSSPNHHPTPSPYGRYSIPGRKSSMLAIDGTGNVDDGGREVSQLLISFVERG